LIIGASVLTEILLPEERGISTMWNGYCPESWMLGQTVRMKLNNMDFYESEGTGLQICVLRGVQAIIMNFRGKGKFRANISFADEIENGEILSPYTMAAPPFNNGEIFEDGDEIRNYINKII